MYLQIAKGKTSQILPFVVYDSSSTTGGHLTALTSGSANLVAFYRRQGVVAPVSISLSGGTVGTWSSGGFIKVQDTNAPGHYELGLPDAALTAGADWVVVNIQGATNMVQVDMLIQLVGTDPAIPAQTASRPARGA